VKRRLVETGAGAILESVAAHYADNEAVLPTVMAVREELFVRSCVFVRMLDHLSYAHSHVVDWPVIELFFSQSCDRRWGKGK
jgi:hypothetical protein